MQESGGRIGRRDMLQAVDGSPYSGRPADGAVIGHRFLHPELRIRLEFPNHWIVRNTREALKARIPEKNVFFELRLRELQKRESAAAILTSQFPRRHIGPVSEGELSGFPMAQAVITMSAPHVSKAKILATVLLDGPRAYFLMGWSERPVFDRHRADFEFIAGSFRRYDPAKDGDIPRLRLYTWKRGDSWEALARAGGYILDTFTARRMAALNGMSVDASPKPGTVVKIVR
jgi:predicted Zn-dependent protease